MLVLFGGILVGWWASKTMRKEERRGENHYHYPPQQYPYPFIPAPREEEEDTRAATPVAREYKQRQRLKKHRGFYLDREGNAMLESPAVHENWVVKKDLQGNIIDTYRVEGGEWLT